MCSLNINVDIVVVLRFIPSQIVLISLPSGRLVRIKIDVMF
jgi:hypothetical protein